MNEEKEHPRASSLAPRARQRLIRVGFHLGIKAVLDILITRVPDDLFLILLDDVHRIPGTRGSHFTLDPARGRVKVSYDTGDDPAAPPEG